jgi:hypothetical protein
MSFGAGETERKVAPTRGIQVKNANERPPTTTRRPREYVRLYGCLGIYHAEPPAGLGGTVFQTRGSHRRRASTNLLALLWPEPSSPAVSQRKHAAERECWV